MLKITKHNKDKAAHFLRRKVRVNAAVKASFPGARIIVNKSNTSIKAQVIDLQGKVICSVRDKKMKGTTKTECAKLAGQALAKSMKTKGIAKAAFDRNGHLYHGRVKALVDGLRTGGIAL